MSSVGSRILSFREHQSIPVDDGLSGEGITSLEADRLAKLGEERPGFFERGYRQVRLAQYCGIVNLGERILEVLPNPTSPV